MNKLIAYISLGTLTYSAVVQLIALQRAKLLTGESAWGAIHPVLIMVETTWPSIDIDDAKAMAIIQNAVDIVLEEAVAPAPAPTVKTVLRRKLAAAGVR